MVFTLENVIPWGRSFAEYQAMFALTEADLTQAILGCSDGPASFNAEATQRGFQVTSCDPLYQFTANQIQQRVQIAYDQVMTQLHQNRASYIWSFFDSPETLGAARLRAMELFLEDFARQDSAKRYQIAALPELPYPDNRFGLALCSHFLFLYSEHFDAQFHLTSVMELCRVAPDIRIFPVLGLDVKISPHLPYVIRELAGRGYNAVLTAVDYEFQRGGNQMLRITRK